MSQPLLGALLFLMMRIVKFHQHLLRYLKFPAPPQCVKVLRGNVTHQTYRHLFLQHQLSWLSAQSLQTLMDAPAWDRINALSGVPSVLSLFPEHHLLPGECGVSWGSALAAAGQDSGHGEWGRRVSLASDCHELLEFP